MWNLAFLFLFILHVNGKSSNLCRLNPPRCDGDKVIKVDVVRCVKPSDPALWTINEISIQQTCDQLNLCEIEQLFTAIESCCGDADYQAAKRPKLRFAYDCVKADPITTKATLPPKMPPTTTFSSPIMNAVTTKQMPGSSDAESLCVTKMCQQSPYCSAGTEIAIMKVTDSSEPEQVMNSLTYYCNKRQRCTDEYEPYVANKCRSDDSTQLHYVCMKEKVTTTVTCDYEETIDNEEGQIRSSGYPNMIPAGTSNCQIKIQFDKLSILELFLLDLPEMVVVYENEYLEWSSSINVEERHKFIQPAFQVLLSVNFDKLPLRRLWVYYRVFPADTFHPHDNLDLPWTNTCMDNKGPMNMTTPKSHPITSESPKVSMPKFPTTNPSKDMHMGHKTEPNHGVEELSTAPHIVIPDGIPVDIDNVDKMEPSTVPAMHPTVGSSSSRPSSGSDVSLVETSPNDPKHHGNREKASSICDTPTTGLCSRRVVIGLIAGVVIMACMVIILLTALVAIMRRRRRDIADGEERDERHNSGPGGTTNENLVSFQYLKTLPPEGDNVTLGTRSQQSEDSLGGDSTSKKSLISKPIKKKNSLAPSENGSSKTADTISSKDDSVFHCLKNTDDFSNILNESNRSAELGQMTKNDNSFTGRSRIEVDDTKPLENHESKGLEEDIFKDVPHFYVNGDDYALVQKDSSRSPRSTIISDKPNIYANTSPRPKSGSSGSTQDSDVLEWTKGFNLAV